MNIVLYTTDCMHGTVLTNKMRNLGMDFTVCQDIETMEKLNIRQAPMVQIEEGKPLLSFIETLRWIQDGANLETYNDIVEAREPATPWYESFFEPPFVFIMYCLLFVCMIVMLGCIFL